MHLLGCGPHPRCTTGVGISCDCWTPKKPKLHPKGWPGGACSRSRPSKCPSNWRNSIPKPCRAEKVPLRILFCQCVTGPAGPSIFPRLQRLRRILQPCIYQRPTGERPKLRSTACLSFRHHFFDDTLLSGFMPGIEICEPSDESLPASNQFTSCRLVINLAALDQV